MTKLADRFAAKHLVERRPNRPTAALSSSPPRNTGKRWCHSRASLRPHHQAVLQRLQHRRNQRPHHHAGTHARQPRQWWHHAPGINRTETSSRTARGRRARLPDWPGSSTADTTKNTQRATEASITSPQNQSLQKSRTRIRLLPIKRQKLAAYTANEYRNLTVPHPPP